MAISEDWKDIKTQDGSAGKSWLRIVREYQMLEKGEITQQELDHVMDTPLLEELDDQAKMTIWKILLKENPDQRLDTIE